MLPSGVVGAVEVSITLYSESAIVDGALYMVEKEEAMAVRRGFVLWDAAQEQGECW